MKKLIISLAFLMTASTAFLQKTETRKLQEIKKLAIFGKTFVAEIVKGDENKIEITSSNVTMDKILTTESNGELKITVKGFNTGDVSCKIYCTSIPTSIEINNGALIKSTESLEIAKINLTTNSDGYIHLILASEEINATCYGGGDMTLEGTVKTFTGYANSNATLRVEMMTIDSAIVKAIGGAEIHLSAQNSIATSTATNGKIHIYKPYAAKITEANESGGLIIKE